MNFYVNYYYYARWVDTIAVVVDKIAGLFVVDSLEIVARNFDYLVGMIAVDWAVGNLVVGMFEVFV